MKIKIILITVAVIIIAGISYAGYSYYKLTEVVKADHNIIASMVSTETVNGVTINGFDVDVYNASLQIDKALQAPAK